jgi:hypothetical protein
MNTLRKLLSLLSRTPSDPRVIAIKNYVSRSSCRGSGQSIHLAVQGAEDPYFFGLFSTLIADLRAYAIVHADVIQIYGLGRALGMGVRAALVRSSLVGTILNNQWAWAYRGVVGKPAYRTQPLFWRLGRRKDRELAKALWRQMRALGRPENLFAEGIQIGDLVIDSYLRFKPAVRFDVNDVFVLFVLQQAVREIALAEKYFSQKRPVLYLTSYSTYTENGIPVRIAVKHGITVRTYGEPSAMGKRLSVNDSFFTPDARLYKHVFDRLRAEQKQAAFRLAETQLEKRLSGGLDDATSYLRTSAYGHGRTAVPDVRGAVAVFLHDFFDSPHVYPSLVFTDFWEWILFTVNTLSDAGIRFVLKPHPNRLAMNDGVMASLCDRVPANAIISSDVSNRVLVRGGIACGVTVYGSVAHELAYLGVPSIACAGHPHSSFGFCRTATTVEEYRQMLLTPLARPLSGTEMREQALAWYYMAHLYGGQSVREFRRAVAQFRRVCYLGRMNTDEVVSALASVRAQTWWREHIVDVRNDVV